MTVHMYATIEQQLALTYGPHTRTTQQTDEPNFLKEVKHLLSPL